MNPLSNGLLSSSDEPIYTIPVSNKISVSKLVISNPTTSTYTFWIGVRFTSGNLVQHLTGELQAGETLVTLQDVTLVYQEQLIAKCSVAGKLVFALYGQVLPLNV